MSKLSVAVLQNRNFRLLLLVRMFTAFTLQAQAVIVGWQIYSITKDPFMLGLVGLAEALPALTCALVSGYIVDHSSPYRVYLLCLAALAFNTLGLYLLAGGVAEVPESSLVIWIFAGVFISGLARSFTMPAAFSILPQIVERRHISAASAWQSSSFQLSSICGPAVAGLIYGGYGAQGAWLLPATMMTLAFILACLMRVPHHPKEDKKREPVLQSLKAGWKFIFSTPVLLSVMALDMFGVLFGGATAMLPAFADQILHVGSQGLGVLRASPALGAIVTGLALALWPLRKVRAKQMLWVVTGFGVCMIGFGLSTAFWLSMLFLILSGALDCISVVMRGTLMQLLTPDHMRGRVSSVNSMFIISSNEIGAFESGVAARFMGLAPSVIFGGLATLAVVGITALVSPKFRKTVVDTENS